MQPVFLTFSECIFAKRQERHLNYYSFLAIVHTKSLADLPTQNQGLIFRLFEPFFSIKLFAIILFLAWYIVLALRTRDFRLHFQIALTMGTDD